MKKRYQPKTTLEGSGGLPQTKGWALWCNTSPKKLAKINAANLKKLVQGIRVIL